jgi:class 3 adenylate cyclase/pimeloyl-ACP methyl ester carboxylesterase
VDDKLRISYAKTHDGLHIAYAAMGNGPPDVVYVVGGTTHLRLEHEEPLVRSYHDLLASFSRLILFDERGTGMSDPLAPSQVPTLEERMDDVLAVLDAAGVERATLLGAEDGGPLTLLIAATYPERVERLICLGTFARMAGAEDYAIGVPFQILEELVLATPEIWGTGTIVNLCAPSVADDVLRERWADYERSAASPGQAQAINRRMLFSDVRPALSAITAPTLVIHRSGDLIVPISMGRYLAEHITRASFVEVPGDDHWPFVGDVDLVVGEIEEFVTGQRSSHDVDRLLATVLFTDIVDSTKTAAAIGDRRWREMLDQHDHLVHRQLVRFRGRAVKSTGDGFLATFDGPVRAMRCACAIRDGARRLGIEVRAGLHTGEIELRNDDVAGIAVHIAARVESIAQPGEVLVSSAIPPLVVGSGISFLDRGEHDLKGVPGSWRLLAVEG